VVGFSMGADDYVTKPFSVKVCCCSASRHCKRARRGEHRAG